MIVKVKQLLAALILLSILFSQYIMADITANKLFSIKSGLNQPTDIAVSHDGSIYSLNGVLSKVIVFSNDGKHKFDFGKAGKGDAELDLPMAIAINNRFVYIADTGNGRISIYNLQGEFIRVITLTSNKSEIKKVSPVSLLIMDKNILWSDRQNHQICVSKISDGKTLRCWGKKGDAEGQFNFPYQLVADSQGYVFVVDVLNSRIQAFSSRGKHFMNTGSFGVNIPGSLFRPNGLVLTKDNYLMVSDAYLGRISVFKNGKPLGLLTNESGKHLVFKSPTSLTLNKSRIYVTDTLNNSIDVFNVSTNNKKTTNKKSFDKPESGSSQKNCITCHISWADNFSIDHQTDFPVSPVAHQDMCYSCHHGVVIDSRKDIGHKEQHPDIHHKRKEIKKNSDKNKDKIPKEFPVVIHKSHNKHDIYCGSCHTPHKLETDKPANLNDEHNNSWMREKNKSSEICLSCHESKIDHIQDKSRSNKGINHPVGLYLKQAEPVRKNKQYYARDKNLHKGLPDELTKAGATTNNKNQMICQSCHKVHGTEEESLTAIQSVNAKICQQCHQRHVAEDLISARKKGVHPVNIKLDEPVKINGKEIEIITCLTCHAPHNGKKDSALLVVDDKNGELCNACHENYNKLVNTKHDLRLSAEKSKNSFDKTPEEAGSCGSCHSMHEVSDKILSLDATELATYKGNEKPLNRDQACLNCHRKEGVADKSQIKFFSHPTNNIILRSDKNNMPLVDNKNEINEFGEIACITCHNPHRWSGHKAIEDEEIKKEKPEKQVNGNVQSSFLRNKAIQDSFCKDCHGIETSMRYKYYHLELSRKIKDQQHK
ncbi:MAG: hypothetical protein DIZ80_06570 [endosymbiont of Galathealinum brachiosum]|uniref:Doubled CXXCH motif domain-containing protein n=1 Tax=endosymbiont of Galathealinum brachiosum TaxID=2200906 RepID=A0A370DHJ4_9GAMM|nr:MAG: hypothetical protein DIZ80_06570 [endosymbiont of Galathealinum brachiosum]